MRKFAWDKVSVQKRVAAHGWVKTETEADARKKRLARWRKRRKKALAKN